MRLIDRLPKSYKELNYKPYIAILNKIPNERPAQLDAAEWARLVNMTTLCILLGVTEADIEALKASEVVELMQAISYLDYPIEPRKTNYKVKSITELTYDEFVTYQRLRLDQWNNMRDILLLVLKDTTPEQVDAMSIDEAMQVFFCLSVSIKRYLIRLKYWTLLRATVQTAKSFPGRLLSKLKKAPRPNLQSVGDGLN